MTISILSEPMAHVLRPSVLMLSNWDLLLAFILLPVMLQLASMLYNSKFHPLRKVPGHWISCSSSAWIRWQRWNGRLSFAADKLLTRYGPIVRISPNMILINDHEAVERIFIRKDLDTSPNSIRALEIGGHGWTVTYPQHPVARQRRHPVMIATTTKCLRVWHQNFVNNINEMIQNMGRSRGNKSEDLVYHLRVCTMKNAEVVMGGSGVNVDLENFPRIVGEYNFLVVWRLCLPGWMFGWLKYSPLAHASFRIKSSDKLYSLGAEIVSQAKNNPCTDTIPSVYKLFIDRDAKYPTQPWSTSELNAEMAGQILAATETTSAALAYLFYELAKNPALVEEVYNEVNSLRDENDDLESLKLLEACIKEVLRFRPPVALTGSRLVPKGGMNVLGHYLPEGTVVTTQSLSLSRQRPDLFPDGDEFNPKRWLDNAPGIDEKRRLSAPFGIGARRCPGNNMALYQMRMIVAATVRRFKLSVPPETTPEVMEPFEANGYRSRYDRCDLRFHPRGE